MPNFSILLPPSEETRSGGNPYAPDMFDYRTSNTFNYFNELNSERRQLIATLQDMIESEVGLEDVFGVDGDRLQAVVEINADIFSAPLMSALDRFSPGVMYDSMDFAGLPTGAQRRLLENGIIFSGLFGLLRPDDLIPDHFLPMKTDMPGVGDLKEFWRPVISPVLNQAVRDAFVWNLLPDDLLEAWDDDGSYRNIVRVRFFDEKGGKRTGVKENVRVLKGRLVNFIVRESLEDLKPLLEWTHPDGYVCDPDATTENEESKRTDLVLVKKA